MKFKIIQSQKDDETEWDKYVEAHPDATLYHSFAWKKIIQSAYGHEPYYLMALVNDSDSKLKQTDDPDKDKVVGILPLFHLKSIIFGNQLISMPFLDIGGLLTDHVEIEMALIEEALRIGHNVKTNSIEIRSQSASPWVDTVNDYKNAPSEIPIRVIVKRNKVRMLLDLPDSSEDLMKSFKSKLRSQIKKPIKEGLTSVVGGIELLDAFYDVFTVNMRDLGSPVHSKQMIENVMIHLSGSARIVIIKYKELPVACSVIIGFKDVLQNPWASALRSHQKLSPNMLLYWAMLEYACDSGFKVFDFGRSTPDEGTYRFKEQWGAKPKQLSWEFIDLKGNVNPSHQSDSWLLKKAVDYWKMMPVAATRILGPHIRKRIGL